MSISESVAKTKFNADLVHSSVFIAQGAVIVGEVHLSEDCSVWFNATMRGDNEPIKIGKGTNIQEGAIFHVDPGAPVTIGEGVTVGHGAIVHGATVGDNTVVGMGSIILNNAVIGENSIVGAGALVTERKTFPPGSLILGSPAKVARALSDEEIESNRSSAWHYVERARQFMAS
ncbi:MAG: gamma carbonic anhydrase family protein [Chloroflexota bacterium]